MGYMGGGLQSEVRGCSSRIMELLDDIGLSTIHGAKHKVHVCKFTIQNSGNSERRRRSAKINDAIQTVH